MPSPHFPWSGVACSPHNFRTCINQQPHPLPLLLQSALRTSYATAVDCSRSCCMNSVDKNYFWPAIDKFEATAAVERRLVFGSCESLCMSFRCSLQRVPIASEWPAYFCCTRFTPLLAQLRVSSFCLHWRNLRSWTPLLPKREQLAAFDMIIAGRCCCSWSVPGCCNPDCN